MIASTALIEQWRKLSNSNQRKRNKELEEQEAKRERDEIQAIKVRRAANDGDVLFKVCMASVGRRMIMK